MIASPTYEVGYSLGHLSEVQAALHGEYRPALRRHTHAAAFDRAFRIQAGRFAVEKGGHGLLAACRMVSLAWLAGVSKHLTPSLFAREIGKLKQRTRVVAVHIKARFRDRVLSELGGLEIPGLEIGEVDKAHTF